MAGTYCRTPDNLVEQEIERLNNSPAVKLAQKDQRLRNARRQRLAQLRWLEKRGKQLMAEGWTIDTIDQLYAEVMDSVLQEGGR